MKTDSIKIVPLTKTTFEDAVQVVLNAKLDTRVEVEHHLTHTEANFIAKDGEKVIGVIGWYQDKEDWATEAMGHRFPGTEVYWVGFFAVDQKYRGRGIGSKLLNYIEEKLKSKGETELWVSSVPKTKSYYQMHGFKTVMTGKIHNNPKVFMVKLLSSN